MTRPLSFRQMQVVWGSALAFAIFCIAFGSLHRKAFDGGINWRHWLLVGFVAWTTWGGISVQRRLASRAIVKSSGADPTSLRAWAASQLVGIALAESIVLWAFVSNLVIASPQWFSDVIYTLGVLLLFKFIPSKPPQDVVS